MAKSKEALPENQWQPVVGKKQPSPSLHNNNNQDVFSLFNSAMDGIFAGLSTNSTHVPSFLPVSNYRDGAFTGLSTKCTVPSKPTFLPPPHYQGGIFSYSWTKGSASSSVPSNAPLFTFPKYGETMTENNQTHAYSTMVDHHVQRALKENENYAVEDNPHSQNLVSLENFNEDHYLYQVVREVVNRIISIKKTVSCSSDPIFLPKATVMFHLDHPDGIFSDFWTKGIASSSFTSSKATVLPDPDLRDKKEYRATPIGPADGEDPNQKIVSYPKGSLFEPFSKKPDGSVISKRKFKNFDVEDYPHPSDSITLVDFNEDHYNYHDVAKCVNAALKDYTKQTELIYELVEVVKVSCKSLGGAMYYITFEAMSPQNELTTFEAEVFSRANVKDVWRVGIRKLGSDWFDGVDYFPKFKTYE